MRTVSNLLIASCVVVATAAACEKRADRADAPSPKAVAARSEFNEQRDDFIAKAREKMAELERRVDAIVADYQAHGSQLEADTREEMADMVDKLERQRHEARASFDRAAAASEERWNDAEKSAGDALGDLQTSASSAAERLRDNGVQVRDELRARAR